MIITGDFHIGSYRNGPDIDGVNGRLLDIKARMWEILAYLKGVAPHTPFIMVGDVFKDKHPSIPEMRIFAEFLQQLISMKIWSYFITGNHDASKVVGQPHALAPFMPLIENTCIHIIDAPLKLQMSDEASYFYFFPYQWHSQNEPLKKFVVTADSKDCLFVHGTIEGGSTNKLVDYELFDEDVIQYDTVRQFGGVFAGHLHDAQQFKNVWYPGSIERLAFGDELSPKSFLDISECRGKWEVKQIPLNARKMLTMHYTQLDELKQDRISVKDAIVRITGVEKDALQSTRKILMDKGCYFIAGLHSADQIVNELPKATGINVAEFVRRFAEKTGYKGDVNAASRIILDTVEGQL